MPGYRFAIDCGGTFTDVFVQKPNGSLATMKLLSDRGVESYDATSVAIEKVLGVDDRFSIDTVRVGTTKATNALLERKGDKLALAVTKGFKDLLHIGNQSREKLFDLKVELPSQLYEEVVEVDERVALVQGQCELAGSYDVAKCPNGEMVHICKQVDVGQLKRDLKQVLNRGFKSLAVILIHSYLYDAHEVLVESIALQVGFEHVSISSRVMPMMRAVPRGFTACVDAYLASSIEQYVNSLKKAISYVDSDKILFIQSDGGLTAADKLKACRAILSGPAGGMIAVANLGEHPAFDGKPLIGFDMGGTSTDVCRFDGQLTHQFETRVAGTSIQCPQLDIRTVAAGGGSRLYFRDGQFVVGPDSVGATPGPVCYGRNGHLALTDANLILKRVLPHCFPTIFGPTNDQGLDVAKTAEEFQRLTDEINLHSIKTKRVEEIALGYVQVANEAMCRPIRTLTQRAGFDASNHVLVCYGGAGGQHACAIAKALGIRHVFIHKYASVFSAFGLALANLEAEMHSPCHSLFHQENVAHFELTLKHLRNNVEEQLRSQGVPKELITFQQSMAMRYEGTDYAITCTCSPEEPTSSFVEKFLRSHQMEFGFLCPGRGVEVENISVRAIGKSSLDLAKHVRSDSLVLNNSPAVASVENVQCYFEGGYEPTAVHGLHTLKPGSKISGPAIILNEGTSVLIEPQCSASITAHGNIFITVVEPRRANASNGVDAIRLSIFSHRFMSIAEQMGHVLRKTAVSTNIKERLDFSCALFDADGSLVANAPHIPVHLGAMAETVKYAIRNSAGSICPGNVLLSNHPRAGGSHLPDLTVITPVFSRYAKEPIFYVANRGHHADIGGLVPGSMPSDSTSLEQEGATFETFLLVLNGQLRERELIVKLEQPGTVKNCSPCRRIQDCVADLKAQVAANQKGISLVNELIEMYGLDEVQNYMQYVRQNAEHTVRRMFKEVAGRFPMPLRAYDHMDDGTRIELKISIDNQHSAVFDFAGTGCEVLGNLNCPKAVVTSAVLYCVRCLLDRDIPLNDGCLRPIEILLPPGSILQAHKSAAVVAANVLTSQRIVDVVLRCFKVCAASQGCMNNLTFGDHTLSYYETVAGGCGAGPTWNGTSGIHSHMTNTRITDVEVLERRHPVIVQRFSLRPNSGGDGLHKGGDGIVRELLFRKSLTLSVLTERRVFEPYGMQGGQPGARGLNLLKIAATNRLVNMGAKRCVRVHAGDVCTTLTPGGGGWGVSKRKDVTEK